MRLPRRASLALLAALWLAAARPSSAELAGTPATVPAVNLARLKVAAESATAPTQAGEAAVLTLDPDFQRTATTLLSRADPVAGAIIVAEARTGRVLVWADRRRGSAAPGAVLLHRQAPAASLFKIATTAALMERGNVRPQQRVCWSGGDHGIEREHLAPPQDGKVLCAPFSQALGHSRNAVYAQLATNNLMHGDLVEVTERLGFNGAVPFDVALPFGHVSVPYDDLGYARTAAGFTNSTLSPLGALSLAYAVAAGGQLVRLHIVERAGEYTRPPTREVVGRVLDKRTAANLRLMMELTVSGGTSLEAFSDPGGQAYLGQIRVAGKTGTLQPTAGDPTTTWFIGFAPSRDPQVVVSVLIENGAVWRRKANEVARDVLRAYFAARGVPHVTDPLTD